MRIAERLTASAYYPMPAREYMPIFFIENEFLENHAKFRNGDDYRGLID
jgi:hypothetical protein